jgi:hypothetical protein
MEYVRKYLSCNFKRIKSKFRTGAIAPSILHFWKKYLVHLHFRIAAPDQIIRKDVSDKLLNISPTIANSGRPYHLII